MTAETNDALNEYKAAIEAAFAAARKLAQSIRKTDDEFPYRKFSFPYVTLDGQLD